MTSHVDPPYVVALSHHPQLFLDDHCVGRMDNLARRVQPPEKFAGNPILTAEHPWERRHLYRPSVIYEPDLDVFRMHYTTIDRPTPEAPKGLSAKCYAESQDGFHWTRPLTAAFPYEGRPSNIVAGGPAHGIRTFHDPQRSYVGAVQKVGIGAAFMEADDMRIELIDEQGPTVRFQSETLPRFEAKHARLVRRDALRYRVIWSHEGTERTLADAPRDRPLIIRFHIRRGHFFAFQIQS